MKTSVRWLLFEYKGSELAIASHFVEGFQDQKVGGEGASQISRPEDWNWCGSCADPVSEALLYTLGAEHALPSATAEPLF